MGGVGTEGATDLNAVPLNIWVDLNSSNALETRYLWGSQGLTSSSTSDSAMSQVDRLFARISSAGAAWYLDDRLGSVRNIVNNSGTLTDTITYDPFGNVLHETGPTGDRYKFAGMQLDNETGLSYDLDRYYDTTRGRFMTEDPSGLGPDVNPYRYVGNDPVNATDPTGLMQLIGRPSSMGNEQPRHRRSPDRGRNRPNSSAPPTRAPGELKYKSKSLRQGGFGGIVPAAQTGGKLTPTTASEILVGLSNGILPKNPPKVSLSKFAPLILL